MQMNHGIKGLSLAFIIVLAGCLASLGARAQDAAAPAPQAVCKVGFVNLQRVLEESKAGIKVKESLEAEKDKAFAPLKTKQKQLEEMQKKISSLSEEIIQKGQLWDQYTRANKNLELQTMQSQYNNKLNELQIERAKIQEDLNAKKNETLKPLEDDLNKVMEEIGKKGGYCLVLDVSPPASNLPNFNPIIYRDPAFDITDEVIKELDK